ncbi:hypothetical protein J6590_037055 [Homalodisca vitripennis]|nr:hypothetical protein J6590_037055 [Homalodisca vitripennis]
MLQHVQNCFIRVLGPRLSYFGLLPLHLRRHHADLLFLFKLVNGLVDSPELRLNTSNYSHFSGMPRRMRAGGVASTHLDFFHGSVPSLRRKVSALCDVTKCWDHRLPHYSASA